MGVAPASGTLDVEWKPAPEQDPTYCLILLCWTFEQRLQQGRFVLRWQAKVKPVRLKLTAMGLRSGAKVSDRMNLALLHFSAFDTRVDTPVDTRNDTPVATLTEKSICAIPQMKTFITTKVTKEERFTAETQAQATTGAGCEIAEKKAGVQGEGNEKHFTTKGTKITKSAVRPSFRSTF